MSDSRLFCRTRHGYVPVSKLYQDDVVFAIDVPPDSPYYLGPVHFLVIPNQHVPSALSLTDDDAVLSGRLFSVASKLTRQKGIADTGVRLITNAGPDAHQTVPHLHVHCIGGRKLGNEC
jgi:histidine triad (HIT) family protein